MRRNAERVDRWPERRRASHLLRAAVAVVPVMAAIGAGILAGAVLPEPTGIATVGWWTTTFVASMAAFYATERAARRFLSLAMLLRLSLVFPDQAPSRMALAMRSGSLTRLRKWALSAEPNGTDLATALERVLTLSTALQVHDRRTRGHCERVRALTDLLADEMGITGDDADRLRWAALLHDIGKISVPAEVLNKPGSPDEREWQILRKHPAEGRRIAASLDPWLGEWSAAMDCHHERWDGTGYPAGLRGDVIPRAARIVAVADAFETMTTVRSYKKPMSPDAARQELVQCAGTHFDPAVVRSFLSLSIPRLKRALGFVAWLAQVPVLGTLPRAAAQVAAGTTAAGAASPQVVAIGTIAVGLVTPTAGAAAQMTSQGSVRPLSTGDSGGLVVDDGVHDEAPVGALAEYRDAPDGERTRLADGAAPPQSDSREGDERPNKEQAADLDDQAEDELAPPGSQRRSERVSAEIGARPQPPREPAAPAGGAVNRPVDLPANASPASPPTDVPSATPSANPDPPDASLPDSPAVGPPGKADDGDTPADGERRRQNGAQGEEP